LQFFVDGKLMIIFNEKSNLADEIMLNVLDMVLVAKFTLTII